jgi:hypothetical protein
MPDFPKASKEDGVCLRHANTHTLACMQLHTCSAPDFAKAGGVLAERMKDEEDVVAGALPFLAQPNPLEIWSHLGRLEVVDHPR